MQDKYLHFGPTDLVCDDDFVSWVLHPDPDLDMKWLEWLDAHPGKKRDIDEAKRIVKAVRFKEPDHKIDTDKLWTRIRTSALEMPAQQSVQMGRRKILRYIAYASAAACIALIVFFTFLQSSEHVITTSPGENVAIQLPDQSRVRINESSRISYDPGKWAEQREVILTGEAFFEVEPGVPFIVTTPVGYVEVLGTRFNVFSRDTDFVVRCHSGKVKVVMSRNNESKLLAAGESWRLSSGDTLQKEFFDLADTSDWRTLVFRFENQPLRIVFDELERQFGVEIEANPAVLNTLYTGFFQSADLDKALQSVCWPMQLQFNKIGTKIVITSSNPQ